MTTSLNDHVKLYRHESEKRRPHIEAEEERLLVEAKEVYKEAMKPYRPGRPRSLKLGKRDPNSSNYSEG